MEELISVIVPIYNVDKYLNKCIDSILEQTYRNLEIILVDDGSTDSCGAICDEYACSDKRIKVIHKINGGLSSARNAGLNICTGSLISFVDSDDYLETNMIEELWKNMHEFESDISICNYFRDNNRKKVINKELFDSETFVAEEDDKFLFLHKHYTLTIHAWGKLYKRELFDGIRYPDGKIYEDAFIVCDLLDRARVVSYLMKPLYNYVYRENSIFHTFSVKHFDKIEAFNIKIGFFEKKGMTDYALIEKNKKCQNIFFFLVKMRVLKINDESIYLKYYTELVECSRSINWTDASKYVKRFKLFGRAYIYWRAVESKVYKWGKTVLNFCNI